MMGKVAIFSLAAGLAIITGTVALADSDLNKYLVLKGSHVGFTPSGGYSNTTLTVSGPNGFHTQTFSKNGAASIDLIRAGATADGIYTYEITVATAEKVTIANPQDNGRGGKDPALQRVGASATGSFRANGGIISLIESSATESE